MNMFSNDMIYRKPDLYGVVNYRELETLSQIQAIKYNFRFVKYANYLSFPSASRLKARRESEPISPCCQIPGKLDGMLKSMSVSLLSVILDSGVDRLQAVSFLGLRPRKLDWSRLQLKNHHGRLNPNRRMAEPT